MSTACFSPQFKPQYLFSTFICFETLPSISWRWSKKFPTTDFHLIQDELAVESRLRFSICYHEQVCIICKFELLSPLNMSQTKKMNRIVEITLLCGSSIFVPKQSVFSFPICMLRCRFLRMSAISFRSLHLTPDWWSFFRSPFIQTESKAFSKSMEITAPFCLFLQKPVYPDWVEGLLEVYGDHSSFLFVSFDFLAAWFQSVQ